MSKRETPLTHQYWETVGGTLIEEFVAVSRSDSNARRLMDGVIILKGDKRTAKTGEVDLINKDIVVVQTKASRLGMNLLGQAVFSAQLMKAFHPKSIKSVAICTKGDSVLERLAAKYGVEVIVYSMSNSVRQPFSNKLKTIS